MLVYHYRIIDKHGRIPLSLAVLADESPSWRPCRYEHSLAGCELRFSFPVVKLLDFADRYQELAASDNPFALAVMAHIKTQQTRHQPRSRARFKRLLSRSLLQRGESRDVILALYNFIDWIMALPADLQRQHVEETRDHLEELGMPYMNFWQQQGMEKGIEQGIEKGSLEQARRSVVRALEARFGTVPQSVIAAVAVIADLDRLDTLLAQAVTVDALDSFEKLLASSTDT